MSVIDDLLSWLRGVVGYVALALAGGTLFALQQRTPTVRAWVAVLLKSLIIGVLAGPAVTSSSRIDDSLKGLLIAGVAFFAEAILYLLSSIAARVTKSPGRVFRWIGWLSGRPFPADLERDLDRQNEDDGGAR